jgi:hypothetical protein
MANRKVFSVPIELVSPKIKSEQITARGTTALLKAARVPGLTLLAPLFHKKNPIPEATKPR